MADADGSGNGAITIAGGPGRHAATPVAHVAELDGPAGGTVLADDAVVLRRQ